MIGIFVEARAALAGVLIMLAGRQDFYSRFDVSNSGVARSFLAAAIALPVSAYVIGILNAIARSADPTAETVSYLFVLVRWLVLWGYFPFLAAVFTRVVGRREGFGPWVVLNNWTHLFIVLFQAIAITLAPIGAGPVAAALLDGSRLLILYAYVLAARGALGTDWTMSIFAGLLNVAAMLGLSILIGRLF